MYMCGGLAGWEKSQPNQDRAKAIESARQRPWKSKKTTTKEHLMKKKICALSLFVLLVTVAAFGSWSEKLAVEIPFDFYVGQKAMPAGTYVINANSATGGTLTLENRTRGRQVMVSTTPAGQSDSGKSGLVFNRLGETYFLAKVWSASSDTGRQLPVSAKQLEMAKAGDQTLKQLALVIQR
jgi:hypothetical protein